MSLHKYLLIIIVAFSGTVHAQKNIDQVLRKYKNDGGVMNLNFTGEVLNMLNENKSKLKSTIDVVDVLIFENKNDINASDKIKIKDVLSRYKFDLMIDIKNKTQNVKLYALEDGAFLNKIYAHVNSPEMNAYFVLSGKIIFEELAKLGMDFQNSNGLKILDKVKK